MLFQQGFKTKSMGIWNEIEDIPGRQSIRGNYYPPGINGEQLKAKIC